MKLNLSNNKNESAKVATMPAVNDHVIEDAVIVDEQHHPQPLSGEKGAKKKGAPKKSEASFYLVTYTTKHGGTGSYVMGFKTEQEAKTLADNACKTVNATWRYNDKGEKVYALSLGSRYLDIAKRLCDALNKGDKAAVSKAIAETHDVYAAAVAAGKAESEAKRKEKKAQEDKAKADELAKMKKANGLYSMTEIAAMMQRALAGEDVPELAAVKEALKAA